MRHALAKGLRELRDSDVDHLHPMLQLILRDHERDEVSVVAELLELADLERGQILSYPLSKCSGV